MTPSTKTTYKQRLRTTRIFADLLFRGEIKLVYKVINGKRVGLYVPKKLLDNQDK